LNSFWQVNLYGCTKENVNVVDQFALENMISDDALTFGILCYCMHDEKMIQNENIAILNPTYVESLRRMINRGSLGDTDQPRKLKEYLHNKRIVLVPFSSSQHFILALVVKDEQVSNAQGNIGFSLFIVDPIGQGETGTGPLRLFVEYLLDVVYDNPDGFGQPGLQSAVASSDGSGQPGLQSAVASSDGSGQPGLQSAVASSDGSGQPGLQSAVASSDGSGQSSQKTPVKDIIVARKSFPKNVIFH
jgi:hypothetical protein